jgi:hypothetical protein
MNQKLEKFLNAVDLDDLFPELIGIKSLSEEDKQYIVSILEKWERPQAISNLLMHPGLIPPNLRQHYILKGLNEKTIKYYSLAASTGMSHGGIDGMERVPIRDCLIKLLEKGDDVLTSNISVTINNFIEKDDALLLLKFLEHPNETVRQNILFCLVEKIGPNELEKITKAEPVTAKSQLHKRVLTKLSKRPSKSFLSETTKKVLARLKEYKSRDKKKHLSGGIYQAFSYIPNLNEQIPFHFETDLEKKIWYDPEWINGVFWGKPRDGHPEGLVAHHINDVLNNIDRLNPSKETREKLRLIALLHDTFKYKVDTSSPLTGENHHGMIARRFAEKYITDKGLSDILELHDEAYNSWQKGNRDKDWNKAKERGTKLINRLNDNLELYLTFFKCDNQTGNKSQESVMWFEKLVNTK